MTDIPKREISPELLKKFLDGQNAFSWEILYSLGYGGGMARKRAETGREPTAEEQRLIRIEAFEDACREAEACLADGRFKPFPNEESKADYYRMLEEMRKDAYGS